MKKTIIIRPPKQTQQDEVIPISNYYCNVFKDNYNCIVLIGENETNKTTFDFLELDSLHHKNTIPKIDKEFRENSIP